MNRNDVIRMLLLSAIWGVSFLFIKWAGAAFPPAWVAIGRTVLGAMVLWTALGLGKHALPPARLWLPLMLVAFFNNVIPFIFFAWGEQTVSSNIAAILNATTPLFSLLIGLGLRDSQLTSRVAAGVLIGLAGVALTVFGGVSGGHADWFGLLLIAAASLGYAVATTIAKRQLQGLSPVGLATSQLSLASLMLLPVALFGAHPANITPQASGSLVFLGLVGSGAAYLLYYGLLARISPTQLTAVTYLLPIWGLFWGFVAGEKIALLSVLGVVVILAGLLLLNFPAKRTQRPLGSASTQG